VALGWDFITQWGMMTLSISFACKVRSRQQRSFKEDKAANSAWGLYVFMLLAYI